MLFFVRRTYQIVGFRPVDSPDFRFTLETPAPITIEWRRPSGAELASAALQDADPPVTITSDNPEAISFGNADGSGAAHWTAPPPHSLLVAIAQLEVSGRPAEVLADVAAGRWPKTNGVSPDSGPADSTGSSAEVPTHGRPVVGVEGLPAYAADVLRNAIARVESTVTRTLHMLIWRSGVVVDAPPVSRRALFELSRDGVTWTGLVTNQARRGARSGRTRVPAPPAVRSRLAAG